VTVNKIRRNGSYAPLSAHYYKDDAIDEAGEAAELLYVRGLAFCADVLSDGFISDRQLVRFVGVGMFDAIDRAVRLVEVGLWETVEGGYRVKSWLDWNRSRAEITDYMAKDRDRKPRSRHDSESDRPEPDPPNGGGQDVDRIPNGNRTESESPAERSPNGVPPHAGARTRSPRNSTPRNSTPSQDTHTAALIELPECHDAPPPGFEEFWKLYPKKEKKQGAKDSWQSKVAKAKVPADLVMTALRAHIVVWHRNPEYPKFVPHPTTWLNGQRWNDELGPHLAAVSGDDIGRRSSYQAYRNPTDDAVWDEPLITGD
jgi:hypothetical protein